MSRCDVFKRLTTQLAPPGRMILVVLVVAIVLLLLGNWLGWRFLRVPAQSFLSHRIGRTVAIVAPFSLRFGRAPACQYDEQPLPSSI